MARRRRVSWFFAIATVQFYGLVGWLPRATVSIKGIHLLRIYCLFQHGVDFVLFNVMQISSASVRHGQTQNLTY